MSRKKTIVLSFLLTLPVILFLIHHYVSHSPELTPTGFTTDENVLYMSYAHQYLDQENFSPFYSNPFDGNPQSPKIYFQPVNAIFVPLLKSGADPGLVFSLFGLIMAFCCVYMGIRIIQHLLPNNKYQALIALLFTWGGGLTAITGIIASLITSGKLTSSWLDTIYIADPANGWWGLNWGRILFIPLEAYYHFLFLLCIYLILKKKWIGAGLAGLLLAASHPFTGIEYLIILSGWIAIEKSFFKNKSIPRWFIVVSGIAITLDIYYHLSYLPSFPEHNQLFNQYSVAWTYSFRVYIPAYIIVALISYATFRVKKSISRFLELPHQRLFLTWAIVSFLLSKHEWFMKPMQPIHFTRGYVWAGLFLLSIPGLLWLIEYFKKTAVRKCVFAGFLIIFLSDNTLWITNILKSNSKNEAEGYLTKETREVFDYLEKSTTRNDLLIGNDRLVSYMANVYSSANAWVSHPYNTPDREDRIIIMNNYLQSGNRPAEWVSRRLIIVINKQAPPVPVLPSLLVTKLFENSRYVLFTP